MNSTLYVLQLLTYMYVSNHMLYVYCVCLTVIDEFKYKYLTRTQTTSNLTNEK